jgi:quercetin dioxygenase-like cupin family protein
MAYAIVSPDEIEWVDGGVSLTDSLGCTDTRVDAVRPDGTGTVAVSTEREVLTVPLADAGDIVTERSVPVPAGSVACVPPGTAASLQGGGTWLAVSATTDTPDGDLRVVDSTDVAFAPPATSDVDIARLTDRLGCTGMKVNLRRLESGEAVPYHTEGTQEELFVPLDGDGTLLVDGQRHELTVGSVARVAPETPRSAINDGGTRRIWLMIGAPPTGDVDGWDPGAEILDWPE